MDTVDIFVIICAALAALTKIIDVVTTIKYVGVHAEVNPIGRWLFNWVGCTAGCWLTFVFEVIVIGGVACGIVLNDSVVEKVLCMLICLFFAGTHISAGVYNTTHRSTPFIRMMIRFYRRLGSKWF